MEPDKNLQDALLRSHQATQENNQAQSQLGQLAQDAENKEDEAQGQPELHEKPANLLKSWDTLRQLDKELVNKRPEDKSKS